MGKKYSINIEDDQVISVDVDGVTYTDPDQIPDEEDRRKVQELMARSDEDDVPEEKFEQEFDPQFDAEMEKDVRELETSQRKFHPLLVGIFAFIALICLAIAGLSTYSTVQRLGREQRAPGKVVDLVVRQSWVSDSQNNNRQIAQDYYYPVVAFSLPDGAQKTVQLSEGSWPPAYEKGQAVTVFYDETNPLEARIQSASSAILMWILPGITGVLGLAFLVAAGLVWWFFKPSPEEQAPGEAGARPAKTPS